MHRLAICLQRIENSLRAVTGLSIVLVENSSTGRPRIRNLEIEDASQCVQFAGTPPTSSSGLSPTRS